MEQPVATAPAVTIRHWHPLRALRGDGGRETAFLRVEPGPEGNEDCYIALHLAGRSRKPAWLRTLASLIDPVDRSPKSV